MYPQIPWDLFADPLGFMEHILGTTALGCLLAQVKKFQFYA